MPKISINSKCNKCGTCIEICPMQCFAMKDDKVIVDKPNACIVCKACEVQCPKEAIKVSEE